MSTPSSFNQSHSCTHSSISQPLSMYSVADTLTSSGILSGITSLTAREVSRANLTLFSRAPPYLSDRLFDKGDIKEHPRYP